MQYYLLHSLVSSGKKVFELQTPSRSFRVASRPRRTYIEPTFEKVVFEHERPTVILISAVGATGKSMLASVLSSQTRLPLLDLAQHPPVAADALTGLIKKSFGVTQLSDVYEAISQGTYGLIIDGVDEARSKTNQDAFQAFLDDIAEIAKPSRGTSFVILGRTQILDDCWAYLTDKGIPTGLLTIAPFTLESARKYIDTFTMTGGTPFAQQYANARDLILDKLSSVFAPTPGTAHDDFLAFLGYPPVLEAIIALLREEPNYHKLSQEVLAGENTEIEVRLLHRISSYILTREKDLKVLPNTLRSLTEQLPESMRAGVLSTAFSVEEQCLRLLSYCLSRPCTLAVIPQPAINERYEAQLLSWLPEHPFLQGRDFRSAVFEAFALTTVMMSDQPLAEKLVAEYASARKHSYHLVSMLSTIAGERPLPVQYLRFLLSAALEFRSTQTRVEVRLEMPDIDEDAVDARATNHIQVSIELTSPEAGEPFKEFGFCALIDDTRSITLGPRLSGTYVDVPLEVVVSSKMEIEITAPTEIRARLLKLNAGRMVLRHCPNQDRQHVLLEGDSVTSELESITTNGVELAVVAANLASLTYPTIQHAEQRQQVPADPALKAKYLRLRRILMEFRSHKRGTLAKYKPKIEHERVLKNDLGRAVLRCLIRDGILSSAGSHYILDPDTVSAKLGVSWLDLRKGHVAEDLVRYLRDIS